ncbi:MAG: hypothetical protein JST80_07960 [Bdellovibrionales bacterium]|nr:hypothetical protein [Bdellovibrionales bacterium]
MLFGSAVAATHHIPTDTSTVNYRFALTCPDQITPDLCRAKWKEIFIAKGCTLTLSGEPECKVNRAAHQLVCRFEFQNCFQPVAINPAKNEKQFANQCSEFGKKFVNGRASYPGKLRCPHCYGKQEEEEIRPYEATAKSRKELDALPQTMACVPYGDVSRSISSVEEKRGEQVIDFNDNSETPVME